MLKTLLHQELLKMLNATAMKKLDRPLKDWELARFLNLNIMEIRRIITRTERDYNKLVSDFIDKHIKS